MKRKSLVLRLLALVLVAMMFTGCTEEAAKDMVQSKLDGFGITVQKNRTITKTSKWVDSSVEGPLTRILP